MPSIKESERIIKIVICYAREDRELLQKGLEKQLRILKNKKLPIEGWYDKEILAGIDYREEIDARMKAAQIIILLISPDFMASDYCYGYEMERAIERHEAGEARVIPIILRPVDWKEAPFSKLQVLSSELAVTKWSDQDAIYQEIAAELQRVIEQLINNSRLASAKIAEGENLCQDNKHEEALLLYEDAITIDRRSETAFYKKGEALAALGRDAEAIIAYEEALRLCPTYESAKIALEDTLLRIRLKETQKHPQNYESESRISNSQPQARASNDQVQASVQPEKQPQQVLASMPATPRLPETGGTSLPLSSQPPSSDWLDPHKEPVAELYTTVKPLWAGITLLHVFLVILIIFSGTTLFFSFQQSNHNAEIEAATTALVKTEIADITYNNATAQGVMDGFDPQHTHWNPVEQILNPVNVHELTLFWIASTGGPISTSPIIDNGMVYITSSDGNLYAFNTAICGNQGKVCSPGWTIPTNSPDSSTPAIADGLLYFGSGDGELHAYDISRCVNINENKTCSPSLQWQASLGNNVPSSPTIINGIVYISAGDAGLYTYDSSGCEINNGCSSLPLDSVRRRYSSPTVANGMVYVASTNTQLFAYSTNGTNCHGNICTPLWSSNPHYPIYSSPSVADGVVYISAQNDIYAYNAEGCDGLSEYCPALWTAATGGPIHSSPAVANGIIYVGSEDHKLYAFNTSGTELWTAQTGGPIDSSPTVAGGVVYVASNDGYLYAFNASGCKVSPCSSLWKYSIASSGSTILFSPAVAAGVVYIGSSDGNLYAFHLPDGV